MAGPLTNTINKLSISKKVGGNFSAAVAIVSRAVLDTNNRVMVEPDYPVGNINGATVATATALKMIDVTNGNRYAVVMSGGALQIIQITNAD